MANPAMEATPLYKGYPGMIRQSVHSTCLYLVSTYMTLDRLLYSKKKEEKKDKPPTTIL